MYRTCVINQFDMFWSVHIRYEALYVKQLPKRMLGEAFLGKYADHNDPVTVIDTKRNYGLRAATRHPIYENFRVKVNRNEKCRDYSFMLV